jgi:hypothetical protein
MLFDLTPDLKICDLKSSKLSVKRRSSAHFIDSNEADVSSTSGTARPGPGDDGSPNPAVHCPGAQG